MSNFDERTNECAVVGGDLSLDQRRARFTAEISRYVGQIRVEDALDLEEFKQLSTTQKFLAMRNSVLAGDVRWSRENPTADIALAVRNLINFISDMHDGCCWISTQRIGELYGRDERTIRRYLQRLLAASLIKRVERPGRSQGYFPLIDRALVDLSASPTWFVDAFSPAPRRAGRPSKRGIHNTVNSENPGHLTPGLVRKPGTPDAGVSPKTPDTSCKNPGHRCPPESSFGVKEEEEEERRRDPASNLSVGEGARQNGGALSTTDCDLIISETLDDFCHEWVRVEGQEKSPKYAERNLRRQISACGEGRPEIVVLAIKRALIATANKEIRKGAFGAYFSQALRTKVKDVKRDTVDLLGTAQMARAKVQVEQEVGRRRVTALDNTIAASTARRDASTMNAGTTRFHGSQLIDGRFDPSAKLMTIGFVPVKGRDANLVLEACPSATTDDA